jgi:hypothetical protein
LRISSKLKFIEGLMARKLTGVTKDDLRRIIHLMPDIEFRRGQAVGLTHLRNPRNSRETDELIVLLRKFGINASLNPKADQLILRLPEATLRQVNAYAAENKMARHETLVMLVQSGLAAADMAERVNVYRQAALERDIADALEPIRVRRDAGMMNDFTPGIHQQETASWAGPAPD